MLNFADQISEELNLRSTQVTAAIELLDDGNTLPFIARYRKEKTGSLDEEQLRAIKDQVDRLRLLDDRRKTILSSIEGQGQLTPELQAMILAANTRTALEDLYQPFKPKRNTRGSIARQKGLLPLAEIILAQPLGKESPSEIARPFRNEDVNTPEDALSGAQDIIAEMISVHPEIRGQIREKALKWGILNCQLVKNAADEKRVYELYYDFEYRVDRLKPYQILAIGRGEREKILRVSIIFDERDWLIPIRNAFRPDRRSPLADNLQQAILDGANRLLLPAIERDIRQILNEKAEAHAIGVFASNLRGLLSQPPLSGHVILAIDPAYRTGCKIAVIDRLGKLLETTTIYPHQPQRQWTESLNTLNQLINRYQATVIAIGNGTASRETEQLAAELTRNQPSVQYLMVNEAGASVYSASKLARNELPELDVSLRGAVSIGRRVLDPLAELVKIDPQSIGVGLYQHDVNQKELSGALAGVVESVVNQVGVDVNTASPALLTYVSGIGPKLAEQIVDHRNVNGRFNNRRELIDVKGLGSKAFEQSAGFLRILDGENPLDASAIHPESYEIATAILKRANQTAAPSLSNRESGLENLKPTAELAAELETGLPTLVDIIAQLIRPGRDPREDLTPPILRNDVLAMGDLKQGMILKGTVRNIVDFGAFIDIGVKQDGLLHRSQIPREAHLEVGQVIDISILTVEEARGRISLGWASQL